MTQKVVNGFPQFHDFTYLTGSYIGTLADQSVQTHKDINLQTDLVGDSITITSDEGNILLVMRDGAYLHKDQGYDIIAPNIVRLFKGLLAGEEVEFKKLTGTSGVVTVIPTAPVASGTDGYTQTIIEATVYTNDSVPPIHAFSPIVNAGKTRISTQFQINVGKVDIYINGTRSSINDGVWTLVDPTTIELNDDYSTVKMKVDIVKQIVG